MKELEQYCHQLELAGKLLRQPSLIEQRLALVLIDNVVDVLLFRAVRRSLSHLDGWMYDDVRPSKKKQQEILRSFPKRCRYLEQPPKGSFTTPIGHDDGKLIFSMHLLRNDTYHEGVIRDHIIREVVHAYASLVPPILSKLWSGWVTHSGADEFEGFLAKYEMSGQSLGREGFEELCRKALGPVGHNSSSFSEALRMDLVSRDQTARELFDYSNAESNFKGDEAFKWDEFWDWAYAQQSFDRKDKDHNEKLWKFKQEHYDSFQPKMRLSNLDSVLKKAEEIVKQDTDASAMSLYWEADKVLKPMEEVIYAMAAAFEAHVEAQIEVMKERRHRDR